MAVVKKYFLFPGALIAGIHQGKILIYFKSTMQ
jgi:hypothetical protein